jgi:hypothetical protein
MEALSAPLRAIAAGSRVAASDPVKGWRRIPRRRIPRRRVRPRQGTHPRALCLRVHVGYFFRLPYRFRFAGAARSLARLGGSQVPFTDSLLRLDLLGRHVLPRVPVVCLECETAGFRESRFSHRTNSVLFKKFWELGVLSGARSRCPSGGHQFPVWLIATPSSSSLTK